MATRPRITPKKILAASSPPDWIAAIDDQPNTVKNATIPWRVKTLRTAPSPAPIASEISWDNSPISDASIKSISGVSKSSPEVSLKWIPSPPSNPPMKDKKVCITKIRVAGIAIQ